MEIFDEYNVCGHQMEKNKKEKFYLGGKGSAPLGAHDLEHQNREGSWHAEETRKNIKKTIDRVSPGSSIDKRRDSRFQLINLIIALNKLNLFGAKSKTLHKASLVNISVNGMQLLTEERLKPGDKYSINVFAPSLNHSMDIKGKVIWREIYNNGSGSCYYRVGFEFIKVSEEVEHNLLRLDYTS